MTGKIPSGLKYSATTGLLTGIIAGKPGIYQTFIQVFQGKTVVRAIAFPINVLEFPTTLIGSFDFLMEDGITVPSGYGWMKGKVRNKGLGAFKGLLGDGTAASITPGLSPYGQSEPHWSHGKAKHRKPTVPSAAR